LAQETRLAIFRLLVRRGAEGAAAGEIAERLSIPKPTLSFHLAQLEGAGLLRARRDGRSIRYAADYDAITALVGFLYERCAEELALRREAGPADGKATTAGMGQARRRQFSPQAEAVTRWSGRQDRRGQIAGGWVAALC
jgi:DNA-binding transcriptional ArsR family regulator